MCSYKSIYDPLYPDIFVMKRAMAFAMLRNFGHLMAHLVVDLSIYPHPAASNLICQYSIEYGFESLSHLSLFGGYPSFENVDKQFVNVKFLLVEWCRMLDNSSYSLLLEKFPNLQSLKLSHNHWGITDGRKISFNAKIRFSALKYFYFHETTYSQKGADGKLAMNLNYREHDTLEGNFKDFLKLNTQIENLDLTMCEEWHPSFFDWLAQNLPNLQNFSLNSFQFIPSTVHFHNVISFTLRSDDILSFSFTKLNHLKLFPRWGACPSIVNFISMNKHLKSINVQFDENDSNSDIFRMFEIEHILLNIEEVHIEGIDCNVPADSLMHFLKRNTSLKKISLIMTENRFNHCSDAILDFFDLIMMATDLYEAKIRNNTLVFTIKRISDGSLMKYYMRKTKIPVPMGPYDYSIKYKNFFEFCNYEKPKLMTKYHEEEMHNVEKMFAKIVFLGR